MDVFRGVAILSVIFFHAGFFPYGFLGVDLFFVISGFLVGGLLIDSHRAGKKISLFRFLISRAFKIWPSYYFFLAAGSLIAFLLYRNSHPNELIPLRELPRYLFFYRNYRGGIHWGFDVIWCLCVEEHYYVILPLIFAFAQRRKGRQTQHHALLFGFIGLIVAGILGRICGHLIHFETYAATHNCIDSLAWGTLLRFATTNNRNLIPSGRARGVGAAVALAVGGGAVLAHSGGKFPVFNAVFFHGLTAPSFALLLLCCLDLDFRKWRLFRFFAYYSYNWYLWHALPVLFLEDKIASAPLRIICYFFGTLGVAVACTIFIEEPALARRKGALRRLEKLF